MLYGSDNHLSSVVHSSTVSHLLILYLSASSHISCLLLLHSSIFQPASRLKHYGSYGELLSWYGSLPEAVRERVHTAGFGDFMTVVSPVQRSTDVLRAFAERWWATTNTFHFSFGEMTITPLDFSMLTGLPCGGTAIPFHRDIHRDPVFLTRCLGARFAESAMFSEQISVSALREFFRDYACETADDVDILARAFLLFLLGSSLLSSVDSTIHLGFLRALEDLDVTSRYDWGGAGLATLYGYIGGIAHGLITRSGGFYHIWEVRTTFPFS